MRISAKSRKWKPTRSVEPLAFGRLTIAVDVFIFVFSWGEELTELTDCEFGSFVSDVPEGMSDAESKESEDAESERHGYF